MLYSSTLLCPLSSGIDRCFESMLGRMDKIGWAKATTVLSVLMHHHASWQRKSSKEANDCASPCGKR